ncbi:hypothetical protein LIS04_123 [Listeria phage LIS04]|nr:hypothetical protein LIS04_123 [Listeria phage LIS04]
MSILIPEVKWVGTNKDKLTKAEVSVLESYDFFNKYATKELNLPATELFTLLSLCDEIYKAHNK